MNSFIVALNCVTPIFLTLMFGYYTRRRRIVPEETFNSISKICFGVLLPLMMFNNVYSSDIKKAISPSLMLYLTIETIAVYLIAFAVVKIKKIDTSLQGVYIQNAFRSNIAVVGISLAQTLMEKDGVALMTVAIALLVPLYNALAVIALEVCSGEHVKIKDTIKSIIKNPMIIGATLGLVACILKVGIPFSICTAIRDAGKAGSIMTLIALGASFRFSGVRKNAIRILCGCFTRLLAVPCAVILSAIVLGFRNDALSVIMICSAAPLATTSYPMAIVYSSDYELTGDLVVVSSLLCCFTMMVFIFLLRQLMLI